MTDTQDLIARLEPFVHGLGKAILREIAEKLEAAQAEIERRKAEEYQLRDLLEIAVDGKKAALARLAELEKQEPKRWLLTERVFHEYEGSEKRDTTGYLTDRYSKDAREGYEPLYAAAGASPEPSALQAENAKLITALAECRDAFPIPDAGSDLDGWYVSAIADPLEVPEYVKACLAAGATPKPAQFNDATQLQIAYIKGLGDGALRPSQADAQRYRLLRSCRGMEHDPLLTVVHEIDGVLWGADLDDAVDAAINAKGDK